MSSLREVWADVEPSPLYGVTVTLVAYQAAGWLHRRTGRHALLNPVLVSIALVSAVLALTGTDYDTYFSGAQPVHLLLGPATVALAVPLSRHLPALRRQAGPLLGAIVIGSLTATLSAVLIAEALGATDATVLSLAPKSATTPVSIGVAAQIGGQPSLTAVFTILTGIVGAICAAAVLDRARVRDPRARGLAIGVASHGIGTARALQDDPVTGAYAGLGLATNALATAVLVPVLFTWVPPLARLVP